MFSFFQDNPHHRPNIDGILKDDFMTQGYMPSRLPPSCLTMAPRFDTKMAQIARRGPLQEINKEIPGRENIASLKKTPSVVSEASNSCEHYLRDLKNQLAKGKEHALKKYDQFGLKIIAAFKEVLDQVLPQLCNFTKFVLQK